MFGSVISLSYLEFDLHTNSPGQEWLVISMIGVLLGSVVAGIVALFRKGTSRIPVIFVLCATIGIGWPLLLMGLVEFTGFVVLWLLRLIGLP
jgi:hypothetical protein